MAAECKYVAIALAVGERLLSGTQYRIEKGAKLHYKITLDNELKSQCNSKFSTDLCVFEEKFFGRSKENAGETVLIPRVVMEFKTTITTHDVLTYSAKAKLHKQVYSYLRYGIIASMNKKVPGLFFTHNESLDFCATVAGLEDAFESFFKQFLSDEIGFSQKLEEIAFGKTKAESRLFRNVPVFDNDAAIPSRWSVL